MTQDYSLKKITDTLTIIIPYCLFIFFWGVKPECIAFNTCAKNISSLPFAISSLYQLEHFQLRYIIFIPFIRLLFEKKQEIYKLLFIPMLVIIHLI